MEAFEKALREALMNLDHLRRQALSYTVEDDEGRIR